jgi:hypothetical protein
MKYSGEQLVILLAVVPTALRPLAILTLFSLFTEVFCRVLWLLKLSNLFAFPIYISVEFGLLVWLYSLAMEGSLLRKVRWPLILTLGVLANLEGILRSSQGFVIDNAARLLESLLVIGLTLAYYHASLRRPNTAYIWREPLFWVSTGLLLFFAGNFLIYTFINFAFYYHRQQIVQIWLVHAALSSLLYCTYAYALWISPKR